MSEPTTRMDSSRKINRRTLLRRVGATGVVAVSAPSLFAACAQAPVSAPTTAPTAPRRGGKLIAAVHGNPPTLDPHKTLNLSAAAVYSHLYSTLLSRDAKLGPKPFIAESWEASADGKTYTFKIRSGVRFHSGREISAEDVRYSLERVRDPKTASPHASNIAMVDQITVMDPRTLKVTLKYSTTVFLKSLAQEFAGIIVAKEVVDQNGDLSKADGGSGPFRLKEFEPNNFYELERFDGYFEKDMPYLDGIRWRVLPESAARQAALRTGQLDWAYFLDKAEWDQLAGDAALVRSSAPNFGPWAVRLNFERKPLDDVRVRQALMIAVDRKEFIAKFHAGQGEVSTFIPSGHPSGYGLAKNEHPDWFEAPQLERARKLLADAGFANGFKGTMIAFPSTVLGCQIIQQQWKRIGAEFDVQQREIAAGLAEYNAGKWDAFVSGGPFYPDADQYLYGSFHSSAPAQGGIKPLKDLEVDQLLDKGRQQPDGQERRQTYVAVGRRLLDLAPTVPISATDTFEVVSPKIQGYDPQTGYSLIGRSMGNVFARVWLSR